MSQEVPRPSRKRTKAVATPWRLRGDGAVRCAVKGGIVGRGNPKNWEMLPYPYHRRLAR